ncbi:MAG: aminoacyl-tRNA hydrolase [Ignavibacteria bacterium]|nr:aminoacyl-tRNA hydrolase [Ignavibacteria bacterium]
MKLIIGLGNPGRKYELTRHNIGFLISDNFAETRGMSFKTGKGDWYECRFKIDEEEICLIKPVTYMNNSGVAVKEFIEKCEEEIKLRDIFVIVDDFQIVLGSVRVRKKGSDGGHNGLSSIIYHLNSDEFPRMRAGIGVNTVLKKDEYIDFVLGDFDEHEIKILRKMMPVYSECILSFIIHGITKTMNEFNKVFEKADSGLIKPGD